MTQVARGEVGGKIKLCIPWMKRYFGLSSVWILVVLLTFFVWVWYDIPLQYITSAVIVAFSVYVHVYSLRLSGVI